MATTDQVWARNPLGLSDVTVKNTHASIAIAAGDSVTLDAANPMSTTQPVVGVTQSTTDDYPYGVAVEAIAVGGTGRVQLHGFIGMIASAAITAGDVVECSTVGKVKTTAGAKPQIGQACTAAAGNLDIVYVKLDRAKNA